MATHLDPRQLLQQINNDVIACEALLELLEKEREALASRDVDSLESIIDQKAVQLAHLENSAKQRTEIARKNSGSNDIKDIQQSWLQLLDKINLPTLKEQWETLKDLQKQCKNANEVNGKILSRNQKTFNRLMEIVRGQTAAPSLYSAAGKSTGQHMSRKMGEA